MKKNQACQISMLILISMFAGLLFSNAAGAASSKEWTARIVSVQGDVQVQKKAETQWKSVNLDDTFHIGDMIKVEKRSRACILICN